MRTAAEIDELLAVAREAAEASYSPYSRFRVGAAVLAEGKVFVGCNVENASYGLTVCAERVAIFNAVAAGFRRIELLVVTCPDADDDSRTTQRMPCGACRQVIAEFAAPGARVIVDGLGEFYVSDLLPAPFKL